MNIINQEPQKDKEYQAKDLEAQKSAHEILENDIQKLAEQVKAIKIKAEKNHISEVEIIKKSLAALTSLPPQQTTSSQNNTNLLPQYAASFPPETNLEIEYLLDMAFHQGIIKALNQALKSQNPAIIDAFHDALAGKLYDELKKRKII